jgi:hypothetical protein
MDRLGRKITQLQGFVMIAVLYVAVAALALTKGTRITGFAISAIGALGFTRCPSSSSISAPIQPPLSYRQKYTRPTGELLSTVYLQQLEGGGRQ